VFFENESCPFGAACSLLLPERLAGGMEADHQATGEEERDLGAWLAADCARLQGRIL